MQDDLTSTEIEELAQERMRSEQICDALKAVMRHAVGGHAANGYTTFCNNSDHALSTMHAYGIEPIQDFDKV